MTATRSGPSERSERGPVPLSPPLSPSSVWESDSFDSARHAASAVRPESFYSRYGNPTVTAFEAAVADLERAESAVAHASGMGSIATTVLALCSAGDHIVAARQTYSGTRALLDGPCRRLGIEVTFVDGTDADGIADAVRPGRTTMVLVESPSNPLLELVDLDRLAAITGPFTVVDSTFATPLGQRPLDHGVDLVVHSATKGIAGHNDATVGVVAGDRDLIDAIWSYGVLHGAVASPFDALQALRGVKTLAVRTAHQAQSALTIARRLGEHPHVRAVHHPGLECHPQHDLARRQMAHFGTVLAVEVAGGLRSANALLESLQLVRLATSLGGPETLACHPMTTTHAGLPESEQALLGITEGLIRISVGLEHPDDVTADLLAALDSAAATGRSGATDGGPDQL